MAGVGAAGPGQQRVHLQQAPPHQRPVMRAMGNQQGAVLEGPPDGLGTVGEDWTPWWGGKNNSGRRR